MTKKIIALIFAMLLCLSMMVSASAYTESYVVDNGNILNSSEISELNLQAQTIENKYGCAVMFCFAEDTEGLSTTDFCEEYYDDFTDSPDGILITLNLAENNYSWYCAGNARSVFGDSVMENAMQLYNDNESYFGGVKAVFTMADNVLMSAPLLNQPTEPTKGEEKPTEATTPTEPTTEFQRVERTLPLVVDRAELLSDEEEKALIARCEAFTAEHKIEIAIVTVNDFEGKTYEEYGDDFYDYNGYGYGKNDDGLLVLFKPGADGERALYITTHGKGEMNFFETIREEMYSAMKDLIIAEDYNGAFNAFLDKAEYTMRPNVSPIWLFVLVIVGAVIGLLIITKMTMPNYTVAKRDAANYARPGSLAVTNRYDNFAYTNTKRVAKAKDSSDDSDSGSRSSTHTSSSGRTHSGTGGTF